MATLSIENVPDEVIDGLRRRAAQNRRSLQAELLALVCEASESGLSAGADSTRTIEAIAAAHQARWKTPFTQAPLATDLIRRDRDTH